MLRFETVPLVFDGRIAFTAGPAAGREDPQSELESPVPLRSYHFSSQKE